MPRMKTVIDRYYKYIRPYRFLYGWAKDAHDAQRSSKRAEEWAAKGFKGAKLDICGGRNPFNPEEFLNVDIVPFPKVDLVFDVCKRFPIDDNVIAEIISIATLEHLRKHHVQHIMQEFFRVLAPGGIVRISTPDIEAIAQGILRGEDEDYMNQQLFGKYKSTDTDDYDVHRWMYTAPQMVRALEAIGFTGAERIPMDIGMHDPQYTYLIQARKK
jgi:predicted SAM-dependent methyltransferase